MCSFQIPLIKYIPLPIIKHKWISPASVSSSFWTTKVVQQLVHSDLYTDMITMKQFKHCFYIMLGPKHYCSVMLSICHVCWRCSGNKVCPKGGAKWFHGGISEPSPALPQCGGMGEMWLLSHSKGQPAWTVPVLPLLQPRYWEPTQQPHSSLVAAGVFKPWLYSVQVPATVSAMGMSFSETS